jgi:nitroreductase
MSKAVAQHPHPSILKNNWSPRSFSDREVDARSLVLALESARRTSSYRDEQPWSFIVTTKDDAVGFERLLSCLSESNASWAGRAPVLILSVAKLNFGADGERNPYAFHDVGQAVSNLVVRASTIGLTVHQMAGFDATQARKAFEIPAGYTAVGAIAIGYPPKVEGTINPSDAGEKQTAPRPLEALAFSSRWGQASPLFKNLPANPCD